MLYFRKCLFALVTPWGRLPAAPFAAMALLLISAHCTIQMYITSLGEDLPPYNSFSMSLFVLMWMGFCTTSRRFHDGGKTAFFLVPLLVVTFASYLAVLDDLHLATSVFEEDRELLRWAERARFALQVLGLVAMVAALVRPGDDGDNAFGPEFYTGKDATAAAPRPGAAAAPATPHARRTVAATPVAAPPEPAPVKSLKRAQDALPSGPRGRITPAAHRSDGFGRR